MKKFLLLFFSFILLFNSVSPVTAVEKEQGVKNSDSSNISDEKLRRFMYFYKGKDPYVAVTYSALIPGSGCLYAHKPGNFFITLLIIGSSYIVRDYLPKNTDEEKRIANDTFNIILGAGYLYGMIKAWYDTKAYNKKLRESINSKKGFYCFFNMSKQIEFKAGLYEKF